MYNFKLAILKKPLLFISNVLSLLLYLGADRRKKKTHSSLASCYAERCSHHLVTEKQAFVQDQQCVISSGPPVRQRHWAQAAGGHFSGPLRTTVNLQTIYLNKGCCVRRKKRHRKQMNKKHQLPGPDLERPGPRREFHTKWLQIGADKPAVERQALTRLPTKHCLGARANRGREGTGCGGCLRGVVKEL